jgi:RimJ/RimL family protein N-acetyltransferase
VGRRFEPVGAYRKRKFHFKAMLAWTVKRSRYPVLMPFPLLSQRVSVEPLTLRDVDEFVRYRQDPETARFQSWDTSYSTQQGVDLVQSQTDVVLPAPGDWLQLAIHDRETGELLGDLALHTIDDVELTFEIGFTLATKNQGSGIAREAVRRLLDFLFDEVGAISVCAHCDSRNSRSIALLDALEFEQRPADSTIENFKGEPLIVNFFVKTKQIRRDQRV